MQHTPVHPTQGALPVPNAATPVPMIAIRRRSEHVTGGAAAEGPGGGTYVQPTLFTGVSNKMRIAQEEVFGPVLAITTFETEEQAIALANDTQYGLAASIYTLDVRRAQRVSRKIKAGTVSVNGFSEGDITAPFGGFKLSGFGGKDKGMEALDQYQQTKAIWYVNQ